MLDTGHPGPDEGSAPAMKNYELTFNVVEVPDKLADELLDQFDCAIGEYHGGQQYITITADGDDCFSAAKAMTTRLQALGMIVQRLQEDLVSRNEIADRVGVTRQAVSNWVRGQRGKGFPAPSNDVAGGVWLWGDIARWAEAHGSYDANGMNYPWRADYDRVNGWLVDGCAGAPATLSKGWLEAAPTRVFVSWMTGGTESAKVGAWLESQTWTALKQSSIR